MVSRGLGGQPSTGVVLEGSFKGPLRVGAKGLGVFLCDQGLGRYFCPEVGILLMESSSFTVYAQVLSDLPLVFACKGTC